MSTELTGAEITVRCLQKEGVDYIFGYPGGAVLFIYDELFKQLVTVTGTGASPLEVTVNGDVPVNAGDELFFDASSRDTTYATKLTLLEVKFGTDLTLVPSALHIPAVEEIFAQPYRGWGAVGYNGNSPRDALPIDQNLLVFTETQTAETTEA